MKLVSKYKNGNKTYQVRRFGDVNLPANAEIFDESGLKISPNENTGILTDSDGNPINYNYLVNNDYYYSPTPGTVYANTPLNEVVVTANRPLLQKAGKFINDEVFLNKDNIRVNNYRRAMAANPNFSQDWDMAVNTLDFTNIASAGLLNRLENSQNIGLVIDAVQGDNLLDSWMGNSGAVSDKFMQEHPWQAFAINTAVDGVGFNYRNIVNAMKNGVNNFQPYVRAYKNTRNSKYTPKETSFKTAVNREATRGGVEIYEGVPKYEELPVKAMEKDNAQLVLRHHEPNAVGVEIHLGGEDVKPSIAGKRFAFRQVENVPSGTYISSASTKPSLEGVIQDRGFLKTLFSRDYNPFVESNFGSNQIPLTENSYELLLNTAKNNPNKFRLDFAHNYRGRLHTFPETVDKSKLFYKLYHEALDTGDLTKLNEYLVDMGAPKATFNELGNIEFSLPILYKRRFGGKLN